MIKIIVYILLAASLFFLLLSIGDLNNRNSQIAGPIIVATSIVLSGCIISASILEYMKKNKSE